MKKQETNELTKQQWALCTIWAGNDPGRLYTEHDHDHGTNCIYHSH